MKELARRFAGLECYSGLESMLGHSGLDAVAVCTPPEWHAELATKVLEAEKHLFVEKPLALSLEACDRVIERAARSTRVAVVGFNLRQHRLLREARTLVRSGTLGRVELVRSSLTTDIRHTRRQPDWRDPRRPSGSVFFELGSHHFDLWRWLLDIEVEEVFARTNDSGSDSPTAVVTAQLTGGVLASAQFAERSYPGNEIEILGEAGRLRVSLYDFDGLELLPLASRPGSPKTRMTRIRRALASLPAGLRGMRVGGDYVATFAEEWRRFAASVREDAPRAATLGDGRAAVAISLAATQSAAASAAVKVV
jgi:predicted dehydrogenase